MSKPNTTDQQLDMQIVSRDKLCAACQPHTWALGWLSVTCVRVPLRLRCTTLMTGCRVSLRCTPPLRLPPTTFYPFNHSPTTSTHPHHPLITSDETVCHLCEGGSLKKNVLVQCFINVDFWLKSSESKCLMCLVSCRVHGYREIL